MSTEPVVIPVQGVSIEIHHGRWKIKTGWPSWGRRSLDVLVDHIQDINVDGHGTIVQGYRINLNSGSARNGIVQRLATDKDARADLHRFLDTVTDELMKRVSSSRRATYVDSTQPSAPLNWLIHPFWPGTGVTGLAAAPSSYKSFFALGAALQLCTGTEVLSGNTGTRAEPGEVLYIDWEDNEEMFNRRKRALEEGAGIPHGRNVAYYRPMRSLVQSIEELSYITTELKPKGIIIDSMSAAIDGSMNDSDVVNEFYNAVHALGAPALVITHKSIENQRKRRSAFQGSGMSLARVRMAWNAEKAASGAIVWKCFKDNHGARTNQRLAWEVNFDNSGGDDEYLDSVAIAAINPSRVRLVDASEEEKSQSRVAAMQEMSAALDDAGPEGCTVAELAISLHYDAKTIRNRLNELHAAAGAVKEKQGKSVRWWHPKHASAKLIEEQRTADMGVQDDLPDPYEV